MTGWSVMLRGIRYRPGRSFAVVLLAAVATMAAVLAPVYQRAAAQSVLTDTLLSAPGAATALNVGAEGSADSSAAAHQPVGDAQAQVDAALRGNPTLARLLDRPVGSVDTDAVIAVGPGQYAARLAWRVGACEQVRIVGECPIDVEQAMLSRRSAGLAGVEVGDVVTVRPATGAGTRRLEIVGLYTPLDASSAYWGDHGYFAFGGQHAEAADVRLDALFAGSEDDVRLGEATPVNLRLAYPLRSASLRLDDVNAVREELGALSLRLGGAEFTADTALPAILDEAGTDRRMLERTVPIIAAPLLLVAWLVLSLLVAALTEERSPQLALARLRGLPSGAIAGAGQTLLLIALGAPLGLLAGLGVVELAARTVLAEGVKVELRWPIFAAAATGLAVACAAAFLAGRRTGARGVLDLLRRVPQRTTWRAGLVDGVLVTLAAASVFAAMRDSTAGLALIAPAAVAVVAGVAAGRLLRIWSRLRLALARRRGHVPSLLAAAQLARRPAATRLVSVLTAAIALLAFAATAWDVASRARRQYAQDALGAAAVHVVAAPHPQALVEAVAAADPSGRSMAVVRTDEQYGDGRVELIGVQPSLLDSVIIWPGHGRAELSELARRLAGPPTEPALVSESLSLRLEATALGAAALRIGALVSAPGQAPRPLWLGRLRTGTHDYAGQAPGCRAHCRFVGLVIGRAGPDPGPIRAELILRHATTSGRALGGRLSDASAWRPPDGTPNAKVAAASGPESGVAVSIDSDVPGDLPILYLDTPDALPAVLAGPAPTEDDPGEFDFPGFADVRQRFAVVGQAPRLPRAGAHGLLFDLDLALRSASRSVGLADATDLRYEVWSAPDAPPDLADRLSAAGVQVLRTQTIAAQVDHLQRRAPALGLRLYLLAGLTAAALALGMLVLGGRIDAEDRRAELGALRITGIRAAVLRRARRAERFALLGVALLSGLGAGVGVAVLMLPGIPLVTVDAAGLGSAGAALLVPAGISEALPVAVVGLLVVMLVAVLSAGRLIGGGGHELSSGGGR